MLHKEALFDREGVPVGVRTVKVFRTSRGTVMPYRAGVRDGPMLVSDYFSDRVALFKCEKVVVLACVTYETCPCLDSLSRCVTFRCCATCRVNLPMFMVADVQPAVALGTGRQSEEGAEMSHNFACLEALRLANLDRLHLDLILVLRLKRRLD